MPYPGLSPLVAKAMWSVAEDTTLRLRGEMDFVGFLYF